MAPKPIKDIDFSDLSDKFLELLRALWTLVHDVCIVFWSYISQAFWAVWTYPPFETFRTDLTTTLIALWDYVVAHPFTSAAICILSYIVIQAVLNAIQACLVYNMGFRERGVLRGSYAAYYQSTSHGGNVSRGSRFARLQSQGAKGGGGYRAQGSTSWA